MGQPRIVAGTRFKQFRIVELIGAGGMGAVFRAVDERLERDVAIKVVAPGLLNDEDARRRFRREALNLSKLNHPNITTIFDFDAVDGEDLLVMELVPGKSLDERLASGPLPEDEAIKLATQLLEGLGAAHRVGILHRDLKPANLRITPEGRLKILDFGLARVFRVSEDENTVSEVTKGISGTAPYMAPEQLRGRVDERSDIFAAGAVMYELVSGKRAFDGHTSADIIDAILNREPEPPLERMRPAVSPRYANVVARALKKSPAERFQSVAEMLAELGRPTGSSLPAVVKYGAASAGLLAVAIALAWFHPWKQPVASPGAALPRPDARLQAVLSGGKPSADAEANADFQRAMLLLMTQSNVPKARELLEQALKRDEHFAEARGWYGFTDVLMIDSGFSNDVTWLQRAEEELRKAQADDPNSARVHTALAAINWYMGRSDVAQAEARRGIELDPKNLDGRVWLGLIYVMRGDYETANKLAREQLGIDDLFFPAHGSLADNYRQVGNTAGAIAECKKVLDVDPENVYLLQTLALVYLDQGDAKRAREVLKPAGGELRKNYQVRLAWALLYAFEGDRREAMKEMDAGLLRYAEIFPYATMYVAEFYALLGDKDKSLEWLEKAVRNGDDRSAWFQRDPLLKNVQQEPRFKQLIESIEFRTQPRGRT